MSLIRRLLNLGRSEALARDIDRELAFHMREHVEELMSQGMSEADAGPRLGAGSATRLTWASGRAIPT
jgi:hypothetical protein